MILAAFLAALRQMGDARFQTTLALGLGLTLALLAGLWVLVLWLAGWVAPAHLHLPLWGDFTGTGLLTRIAAILALLMATAWLMVPVASAFIGLFLDRVAAAVEARHYPGLPPPRRQSWAEGLRSGAGFLTLVLAANLLALALLPFTGPLAPPLYWALNGWLLGREYFTLAALRHFPPAGAKALYRAHRGTIFAAGLLMAVPLSLPLVGLVIPVLGAATFTHLVQRLRSRPAP